MAYFPGTQSFRQPYPRKRTEQGGDNRRAMTANGLPNVMARGLPVPGRGAGNRKEQPPGWSQGNAPWKNGGMPPGLDNTRRSGGGGKPSPGDLIGMGGGYPGRPAGRPIMGPYREPMPMPQTPPWNPGFPGMGGPPLGGRPGVMTPYGGGGMTGGGMLDLLAKLLGGGPFVGR